MQQPETDKTDILDMTPDGRPTAFDIADRPDLQRLFYDQVGFLDRAARKSDLS
jgi:hypothetical protein